MSNYEVVAKVIHSITQNTKPDLSLDQLAAQVNRSPDHLQKIFSDWAGISPKQFQRFLSLEYSKNLLKEGKSNLETSFLAGLSSSGRLHDLYVDIEAMTPGEYKNGGRDLTICYSVHDSNFGEYLVASTTRGVCNVLFLSDKSPELELRDRWSEGHFVEVFDSIHQPVVDFLSHSNPTSKIKLHLKGTNFQLQVWRALLLIPEGRISSYGQIAKNVFGTEVGSLASRSVGTAIGDNPIGFIIPCHRVLRSTGEISGYRWGVNRKKAILGWEAAILQRINKDD
jgi:AraC family transcriptional regulator, regulatory protein of adaptative response / methylated-DNA-[protein]-cysteine methyltransferase